MNERLYIVRYKLHYVPIRIYFLGPNPGLLGGSLILRFFTDLTRTIFEWIAAEML